MTNDKNANNKSLKNNEGNQKSSGQTIKTMAKDTAGQAKEKAANVIDDKKSDVASGLSNVADSIRKVGENLRETEDQNKIAQATARYGESLAERIESFSDYVEQATLKDLTRDIEGFARRQPSLFIGGAFLVGLLGARFLKTSSPHQVRDYQDNYRENVRNV